MRSDRVHGDRRDGEPAESPKPNQPETESQQDTDYRAAVKTAGESADRVPPTGIPKTPKSYWPTCKWRTAMTASEIPQKR